MSLQHGVSLAGAEALSTEAWLLRHLVWWHLPVAPPGTDHWGAQGRLLSEVGRPYLEHTLSSKWKRTAGMIFQLFLNHRIILLFVHCNIKFTPLGRAQSKAEVPLPYCGNHLPQCVALVRSFFYSSMCKCPLFPPQCGCKSISGCEVLPECDHLMQSPCYLVSWGGFTFVFNRLFILE